MMTVSAVAEAVNEDGHSGLGAQARRRRAGCGRISVAHHRVLGSAAACTGVSSRRHAVLRRGVTGWSLRGG